MPIDPTRRTLLFAGAAVLVLPRIVAPAAAQTAETTATPLTLAYPRQIGDLTLTAILDGSFSLDQSLIINITPEETAAALESAFLDPGAPIGLGITAHLVQGGGRTMLIDAGAADLFGPTAGRLVSSLAALGVAPGDVDTVLLTHMHPDHIGGMVAADAAAFPNAEVRVHETDLAFWTDEAIASGAPADAQPYFARARRTADLYGDRLAPFAGEAEVAPGVTALPLPGHTPGHAGFRLASGDAQILVAGDAVGLAAVQFGHPGAGLVFDTDPALAASTRTALLDMTATDRMLFTATHLPFPTLGHVVRSGDAYAWAPEQWRYQ